MHAWLLHLAFVFIITCPTECVSSFDRSLNIYNSDYDYQACTVKNIYDKSGVENVLIKNESTRICWNFIKSTTHQYIHLRFKELFSYENGNCGSEVNGGCNLFYVSIYSPRENVITYRPARDNHQLGILKCDETPSGELIFFAQELVVELHVCSHPNSPTKVNFQMDYSRDDECSYKFEIDTFKTIHNYHESSTTVMNCSFNFSVNHDFQLQITNHPRNDFSLITDQSFQIFDGIDDKSTLIGIWNSESNNGDLSAYTSSSNMFVKYSSYKLKYYGSTFTVKVKGYCLPGYRSCGDQLNCYKESEACDGIKNCVNSKDELGCGSCARNEFRCQEEEANCISSEKLCDGYKDCYNDADENRCLFCNETSALRCLATDDRGFVQCYRRTSRCDGFNDCLDSSDENGCPRTTSRKVITASIIGALICGVLFACALGCSMKLFGIHSANNQRHHLALQQTPIGRMTRRLLQREAPPSYNMAVHGQEVDETSRRHRSRLNNETSTSSAQSQRRHRRRHRRRRNELRIRRSQPCAADLASLRPPHDARSPSTNVTRNEQQQPCESDRCEHLLCNEFNTSVREQPSAGVECPNSRQDSPLNPSPFSPSISFFPFSHEASIVNFPLSRICSRVPRVTIPRAAPSSNHQPASLTYQQQQPVNDSATDAAPLPKKRPIKPVLVGAPCDDVSVDQTPSCIYPNPPTYVEATGDNSVCVDMTNHLTADNQLEVDCSETNESVKMLADENATE